MNTPKTWIFVAASAALLAGMALSGGCAADDASICGDGVVDSAAGEACDDGNTTDGDGCSAVCQQEVPCGNGLLDPGEECDDGGGDSATCNADCTEVVCGDRYVNEAAGEDCDDGGVDSARCNFDCTAVECSDGHINEVSGEVCEDGNMMDGDGCSQNCRSDETCGNGVLDSAAGEECDDNAEDSADCDADCTRPVCGDGHVNEASGEICDDEGAETATCNPDCTSPVCGDGYVNAMAGEQCDDLNQFEFDACSHECRVKPHIVAGDRHTCALLASGDVRCWGEASSGQLGYGDTDNIGDDETLAGIGPVDIGGAVVQLAAGKDHTCALLAAGTVRCWGEASSGQLGYGNTDNIGDTMGETPASAGDVHVGGTVVQIAAGGSHTCALLATGTVRCWGQAGFGQLGYGNTDNIGDDEDEVPANLVDPDVDLGTDEAVVQIAAGGMHTCALLASGEVHCWGRGHYGQLGYGTKDNIGDKDTPADAGPVNVGGGVIQIVAGEIHTCALLGTGAVRCWGSGQHGRLGYGNTDNIGDNEAPADIVAPVDVGGMEVGAPVKLTAGKAHTCALFAGGEVRCWGFGDVGRLGHGNIDSIGDDETPASAGNVAVTDPGDPTQFVAQIAAGGMHTCALRGNDAIRCWGFAGDGQLGYGNTTIIGNPELPYTAGDVPLTSPMP